MKHDHTSPCGEGETRRLKTVCVYCGTGEGADPAYMEAARELGRMLAAEGLGLVYGGGSLGLMGAVANAALEAGGHVTGVIPAFLEEREVMMQEVSELVVTSDMHERKRTMFERADGFVALPGGIGTLEEVVEMLTWGQLGQHCKPVVLADIGGFWRPLVDLLAHMRGEGFIRAGFEVDYRVANSVAEILPALRRPAGAGEGATEAGVADLEKL
ncbi:TIGR00730 family Rossman fold protein [Stappia indica]|uniref:LOG family protein n=1 Tax=Stappia indica TaxID=538381 RepID=UPI00082B63E1|nr:TIGR00730 family Rossman fold protein [Stappia indica]